MTHATLCILRQALHLHQWLLLSNSRWEVKINCKLPHLLLRFQSLYQVLTEGENCIFIDYLCTS